MAFAIEPKSRGEEDKVFAALRRLQEEDPTIDLHRDQQTGEQIVAGLSQVHVEVIVDRLRDRFGVEVTLQPPRVPYQETIRRAAGAHGRHKKQSGGRGQFGDCRIEIEPLALDEEFEFIDAIKGGVIPHSFIPGVEKGVREAMRSGVLAGYPVKGVRVRLVDGPHHSVDSSEIAFKLAGTQAMRQALELADPVLLEPVMLVTLSVPDAYVGDVIGDLNSRRGRPLGMEPNGTMSEIRAEVPMAEMLSYAPDLRSITGGQGDYTLEFLRYEELPAQLAQKLARDELGRARGRTRLSERLTVELRCWAHGNPIDRHVSARCRVRGLRAAPAARRAAGRLPRRRPAADGLRAVRSARCASGLEARLGGAAARLGLAVQPSRARPAGRLRQSRRVEASRNRRDAPDDGPQPFEPFGRLAAEDDVGRAHEALVGHPSGGEGSGEPLSAEQALLVQAIEAFNASEYTRRAASLARSLGTPEVTVRPGVAVASSVVIVLAWELCWYSYEVDLDDMQGVEVRAIGQGTELAELGAEDRLANALADERGALSLT